jgi:hypothetical protein
MTPEERWERLAHGLWFTAFLLIAYAAYGIYSGDDLRGLFMTVLPAAICAGVGYLCYRRAG